MTTVIGVGGQVLGGSYRRPRHGEHRITRGAPLRLDVDARGAEIRQHRPPPVARTEQRMPGGRRPCSISRGEQSVDRLARNIVVDKHFGQPFGSWKSE